MKQFLNVLKFELGNYFKSKSFMVTTILLALAVAASQKSSAEAREVRKPPEKRRQKAALLMAITIRMQMYWLLQIRMAL